MSQEIPSEAETGAAGARYEPRVSVIIPVPPEMERPGALEALEQIDYPSEKVEVIIARGRRPAVQRNEAAKCAGGEILFFLDDDSCADAGLVREQLCFYEDEDVAGVGGPALPLPAGNTVQAATDIVFASVFGDFRGCMRFARRGKARPVSEDELILCNMSVRKSVFDELGGFHDALYPNEENAFLQKVLGAGRGWKFMYAPDAVIRRPRPRTVWEFAKKVFGYGTGRLEQSLVKMSAISLMRLGTVFFPLYWLALPFLLMRTRWAAAPALLYFAGNVAMTVKVWLTVRAIDVAMGAFWLFPVMHAAYPAGILWAATGRRVVGRKRGEGGVEIEVVKSFDV